jgi:hypothetical protein
LGGVVGPLAAATYYRQLRRLNQAMGLEERAEWMPVTLSVILAAVGAGMGVYLILSK